MEYKRENSKWCSFINNVKTRTCRKFVLKFAFYVSMISLSVMVASIPHIIRTTSKPYQVSHRVRYPSDLKYVLLWKASKDTKRVEEGQSMFVSSQCEYINCYLSSDENLLRNDHSDFDAIVFNARDLRNSRAALSMRRYPHQKYIFRSSEMPRRHPMCDPSFDNFFNLTWTYKLNSNIPSPFFYIYNAKKQHIGPKINMHWIENMTNISEAVENSLKHKKKAVAWVVPSCNNKQAGDNFVKQLRQELLGYNLTVDDYGACSQKSCPGKKRWKCYKMIEKEYYFSIVAENHMAEDYVTSEVVKIMTHNTIPLVYGGANYSNFLPPGSYVDTRHNLSNLGAIINYLTKNPTAYSRFFDWKNHYYLSEPSPRSDVCELCKMLNDKTRMSKQETQRNFRKWWNPTVEEDCRSWFLLNNKREPRKPLN